MDINETWPKQEVQSSDQEDETPDPLSVEWNRLASDPAWKAQHAKQYVALRQNTEPEFFSTFDEAEQKARKNPNTTTLIKHVGRDGLINFKKS